VGEGGSWPAAVVTVAAHKRREQGKSNEAVRRPVARKKSREAKCVNRMKDVFIGRLPCRRLPGVGRERPDP